MTPEINQTSLIPQFPLFLRISMVGFLVIKKSVDYGPGKKKKEPHKIN